MASRIASSIRRASEVNHRRRTKTDRSIGLERHRRRRTRLSLPVLLIAGEQDEIAALPDQHTLLALLPDGHLDVIPGVGHLIHYETPEPAAGFIRRFLKDRTP